MADTIPAAIAPDEDALSADFRRAVVDSCLCEGIEVTEAELAALRREALPERVRRAARNP